MIRKIRTDWRMNWSYYILFFPVLVYYIVFMYLPMFGLVMAFENYNVGKGFFKSQWVGFDNFKMFFGSYYFERLLTNTIVLSLLGLAFGLTIPVLFALLLNEVTNKYFKKTVQLVTYMPYFISMVVVASLIRIFVAPEGPVGNLFIFLGLSETSLLAQPHFFRGIMVVSDMWQMTGYFSIIYLAAISAIDHEMYEAAYIDGAGRWKQTLHITLPSLAPTIIVMLIMRVGQILNVGADKIILLYSPAIYSKADVISTFVYRKGLLEMDYSYAAAVGMFNSVVGFIMIMITNYLAKKTSETRLF